LLFTIILFSAAWGLSAIPDNSCGVADFVG